MKNGVTATVDPCQEPQLPPSIFGLVSSTNIFIHLKYDQIYLQVTFQ